MKINISQLAVICFFLMLSVLLSTSERGFSRVVRKIEISWDEFTENQIQRFRSKYDSWQYIKKRDILEEDIKATRKHVPMIIDWVSSIFDYYKAFGEGKLVFLGGAAKKAYQAAKVLSLEYDDIDSSSIVYIDMPRKVIGNSSEEVLSELMRQESIYEDKIIGEDIFGNEARSIALDLVNSEILNVVQ